MKDVKKILKKIRKFEAELAYAKPSRAAKLTSEIVKLKAEAFDQ